MEAFGRLIDVLDTLRVKCPWDAKQTNESLRPNTVEEVYELCEALINADDAEIRKELGDVLLHVLFYSKIAEEKGQFDIADVCDSLVAKLKFRHPHIYGDVTADNARQVAMNWEDIKLKERPQEEHRSVLDGVPSTLPALNKAFRIQEKAANAGFDWQNACEVWAKVTEEIGEFSTEAERVRVMELALARAAKEGRDETDGATPQPRTDASTLSDRIAESRRNMEEEMGDVFFSLVNAARLYRVIPENALEKTNKKFISRFYYIENRVRESGRRLRDVSLEEMDALWEEAKKKA